MVDDDPYRSNAKQYDEWFDCTEEASRCNDDRYQADEDACRVQAERLSECAEIGVF